MKKIAFFCLSLLVVGAAYASSTIQSIIPSDVLDGNKEASISYQADQVHPTVSFATTGYTIFGVIYVAAAMAKMKQQTGALQQSYDTYLTTHSEIKSLRDTFNQELQKDLQAGGLHLVTVSDLKRSIDEDKQVTYQIASNDLTTKKLLVFDNLNIGYFAPSSTDPYTPHANVLVSVIDQKDVTAKPVQYVPLSTSGDKQDTFTFKDFDELNQHTQQSYAGLQLCATRLAQQIADRITGAPLPPPVANAAP